MLVSLHPESKRHFGNDKGVDDDCAQATVLLIGARCSTYRVESDVCWLETIDYPAEIASL